MTLKNDGHGNLVQASRPALTNNIAFTGASQQSAAFASGSVTNVYNADGTVNVNAPNNTTHIRLVATTNCWVAFGSNPVAIAAGALSILLPAYTPEYFFVNRGERLAVIQDSGGGTLNIAELVN